MTQRRAEPLPSGLPALGSATPRNGPCRVRWSVQLLLLDKPDGISHI
jgi:hypothetical protein